MYEMSCLNFITPGSCLQAPGSYFHNETRQFGLRKHIVFCSNCDQLLFTQTSATQRYDKILMVNVVLPTNEKLKLIVVYIVIVRSGEKGGGGQCSSYYVDLIVFGISASLQQRYCYRQYVESVLCQLNLGDYFRFRMSPKSANSRMRIAIRRQSQLSFQFATVLRYVSFDCGEMNRKQSGRI